VRAVDIADFGRYDEIIQQGLVFPVCDFPSPFSNSKTADRTTLGVVRSAVFLNRLIGGKV
jgi:hypothetical protein